MLTQYVSHLVSASTGLSDVLADAQFFNTDEANEVGYARPLLTTESEKHSLHYSLFYDTI